MELGRFNRWDSTFSPESAHVSRSPDEGEVQGLVLS